LLETGTEINMCTALQNRALSIFHDVLLFQVSSNILHLC